LCQVSLLGTSPYLHHTDQIDWTWASIGSKTTIWTPSPEFGCQALAHFLDYKVDNATENYAIFLIPPILQRDWGISPNTSMRLGRLGLTPSPGVVRMIPSSLLVALLPLLHSLLASPIGWSQLPLPVALNDCIRYRQNTCMLGCKMGFSWKHPPHHVCEFGRTGIPWDEEHGCTWARPCLWGAIPRPTHPKQRPISYLTFESAGFSISMACPGSSLHLLAVPGTCPCQERIMSHRT
jgi:hypothetical protein